MDTQATCTPEVERLQLIIRDMNGFADHGFGTVAALARLARLALAQPEEQCRRSLDDIRLALVTIVTLADDMANAIDVAAERQEGQP